jgi:hypothetical protein
MYYRGFHLIVAVVVDWPFSKNSLTPLKARACSVFLYAIL